MNALSHRTFRHQTVSGALVAMLIPGLAMLPPGVRANPSGGVVAAGLAEINAENPAHLMIFQQSNRAVINWQDFNIAAGEITEFIQPGVDAMALSRVVSGNPSAIYGLLKANGGHILVNQNGILVGPGGVVDVAGMNVLSTLDIDDGNFMAGGDMHFSGTSTAGVSNFGTINSAAGDVILMGNFVENHGSIGALNGTVALAAGGEILLHTAGDAKVSILRQGAGGSTGVNNTGTITGAAVEMKAHGNVYALAVNNSGTIRATGANRANGRVILSATGNGTGSGKIVNTGTIEANNADGSGGIIQIDAGTQGEVELGGTVKADGVGGKPGGAISVLGNTINVTADAKVSANGGAGSNGGTVIIGSPDSASVTVQPGASVQATGSPAGVIRVSGDVVGLDGVFDASSPTGTGGTIEVKGADVTTASSTIINASGLNGGRVDLRGIEELTLGGRVTAEGQDGAGGQVVVTADRVLVLDDTRVSVNGRTSGGKINLGGGFQGRDSTISNAENLTVGSGATLSADSTVGNGGQVVVWSDKETYFEGSVSARAAGDQGGHGGFIEVSGKETLTVLGGVDASSISGRPGTVLFDPGNVFLGNSIGASIQSSVVNNALQGGTSVIIATESGNVTVMNSLLDNDRHDAIQWTHSDSSFAILASGDIRVLTHIRTSGGGSVNLVSGWTGFEADLQPGGLFDPGYTASGSSFTLNGGAPSPEAVWEHYVESGQFGQNGGDITIGGLGRHVEVGSRFGNTNVAGANVTVAGFDGNATDSFAILGFHDSGKVFSVTGSNGLANAQLDINAVSVDNDVLVGVVDPAYFRDVNGDTVADGVYAINSAGLLDGSAGSLTPGDPTLIPFANHFTTGNWWYQQLPDLSASGLGNILPEHGAGQSASQRADINVVATGNVSVEGGGRERNSAQIGHGGFAGGGTVVNNLSTSATPFVSYNGSPNTRNGSAIGRLGTVHGNINVLAGAIAGTVQYDSTNPDVNLTATTTGAGSVNVRGWQNTASSNNLANPETANNFDSYAQIGHMGLNQFGKVEGNITVQAGDGVNVLAGAHTRNYAAIGHQIGGASFWNPVSNEKAQVRLFNNASDFNNPNLRKGELFADPFGGDARGYYPENFRSTAGGVNGLWDDDFYDTDGDLNNNGNLDTTDPIGGVDDVPVAIGDQRAFAATGRPGFTPIHIEGLSGAVDKTITGDITVDSFGATGVNVVGFSNPDTRVFADSDGDGRITSSDVPIGGDLNGDTIPDFDGLRFNRETRFAQIGHGGLGFGFQSTDEGDSEQMQLRVNAGDGSGASSASEQVQLLAGEPAAVGTNIGRRSTFINLIGDIEVNAHNGGVDVTAGNNTLDFATIGHGGVTLFDLETGNVAIGDITVTGATDLNILGGGVVAAYSGTNALTGATEMRSYAQIGHHGYQSGNQYYTGDISVDFGGDITLISGGYAGSEAKIGHQSQLGYGQVGGSYERTEQFLSGPHFLASPSSAEFAPIFADAFVTSSEAVISVGNETNVYDISGFTADISVSAGGNVLLTHDDVGLRLTQNGAASGLATLSDIRFTGTQIGHGGISTGTLRNDSLASQYNFKDKTGNITVAGNNVDLENGSGPRYWTNIGHIFGLGFQGSGVSFNAGTLGINAAGVLSGNINIMARGNLDLDAAFANSNDNTNVDGDGIGDPAVYNFVRVGHGAVLGQNDVVVLSNGAPLHGIVASSDISIDVAGDMNVRGGNGQFGSYAQVGHGNNSAAGGNESRPFGFAGSINVGVDGDLTLVAGSRAVIRGPGNTFFAAITEAATIGHGGDMIDATMTGNITVDVGNDLEIRAAQRTDAPRGGSNNAPLSSLYDFAKIGHWTTSLQDYQRPPNPPVGAVVNENTIVSAQTGDISITVGNDMRMSGGTTENTDVSDGGVGPVVDNGVGNGLYVSPTIFGFAQVGHSTPGVTGLKEGDIDIRVGRDLTTVDGTVDPNLPAYTDPVTLDQYFGTPNFNNYVMIGNGDWLRDGSPIVSLPVTGGTGLRSGDISIATGRNATFNHTLVGHADPALITNPGVVVDGHTYVAVGRNLPFFGGAGGILTSTPSVPFDIDPRFAQQDEFATGPFVPGGLPVGSVFTSGRYGGDQLRFYLSERENNFLAGAYSGLDPTGATINLASTTRLNTATTVYRGVGGTAGTSFTDGSGALGRTWDPTRAGGTILGSYSGDADEIYLQPDLWWNRTGVATIYGTAEDFPTGSIATVEAPGGLPNLIALSAGVLGDGTADYRGAAGSQYTFYYDAITEVDLSLPVEDPVIPPPVPEVPVVVEVPGLPVVPEVPVIPEPVIPFNFLPFIFWDKYDSYDRDDSNLITAGDNYLDGIGLVARMIGDVEGEPGVGAQYESEAIESLAEILGFPVDETDEKEEDEARERREGTYKLLGRLYGIYWTYEPQTQAGKYNSYRLFGRPGL
jgi:filamentous hemagglutinin family protein